MASKNMKYMSSNGTIIPAKSDGENVVPVTLKEEPKKPVVRRVTRKTTVNKPTNKTTSTKSENTIMATQTPAVSVNETNAVVVPPAVQPSAPINDPRVALEAIDTAVKGALAEQQVADTPAVPAAQSPAASAPEQPQGGLRKTKETSDKGYYTIGMAAAVAATGAAVGIMRSDREDDESMISVKNAAYVLGVAALGGGVQHFVEKIEVVAESTTARVASAAAVGGVIGTCAALGKETVFNSASYWSGKFRSVKDEVAEDEFIVE